jgi:hypothetical protein
MNLLTNLMAHNQKKIECLILNYKKNLFFKQLQLNVKKNF